MSDKQSGLALRSTLITVVLVIAFAGLLVTRLPQGYSDDIGRIGRGADTAVLVHDKNGVQSQNLMTLVSRIRSDYAGKIEFLVADVGSDPGQAFLREQQLGGIGLVLFAADGRRLQVLDAAIDEPGLRAALSSAFGRGP